MRPVSQLSGWWELAAAPAGAGPLRGVGFSSQPVCRARARLAAGVHGSSVLGSRGLPRACGRPSGVRSRGRRPGPPGPPRA